MPGRSRWENPMDGDPTASHTITALPYPTQAEVPTCCSTQGSSNSNSQGQSVHVTHPGTNCSKPRMGLWLLQRQEN